MFKFYNIPDLGTLDKIIGDNPTIKFSSAFNLNDPYELKFNLILDPLADGQKEEFFEAHPYARISDFKDWQEQVSENFVWYVEQQQRDTITQLITLAAFTESNKNNLMWSHYTNNHRGICVEYSENLFGYLKTIKGFFAFANVQYSDEPPSVDSLDENKSKILKMMFNKQSEWKYERESRVILLSSKDTDYISINRQFIKAVYIGSKAEETTVNEILKLCKSTEIEIYYGITLGNTYEVQFRRHEEGTFYSRTFWA
jgi:hypothetical protein